MIPPTGPEPRTDTYSSVDGHANAPNSPGAGSNQPVDPGFGPPAKRGEIGTLGPYRIVKQLGHGGMGAVYAALDTRLERRIALKVMLPQFAAVPTSRERFLREARAAARIKHGNVLTIYEADVRDGIPYIAMEFLEGYPLDQYLKKKGNPTVPQLIRIAAETAAGLDAAHKLGLIHRDVKPGNLWLEVPNGRVKVLDFGLAKPIDAEIELTKSGVIIGTPAYMSPEQARGEKVDPRSDLFSLGAVIYRLATGKLPFSGPNTMAVLLALGTEDPKPVRELNPDISEPLEELIHQLLAKRAADRPSSAEDVVHRLRAIARNQPGSPSQPVDQSTSMPQVVYVTMPYSMPVTMAPEANPFADIDMSDTIIDPRKTPTAAPQEPAEYARRWPLIGGGVAAFLIVAAVGVTAAIKLQGDPEANTERVSLTNSTKSAPTFGKTTPRVPSPATQLKADEDIDRQVAEWSYLEAVPYESTI